MSDRIFVTGGLAALGSVVLAYFLYSQMSGGQAMAADDFTSMPAISQGLFAIYRDGLGVGP